MNGDWPLTPKTLSHVLGILPSEGGRAWEAEPRGCRAIHDKTNPQGGTDCQVGNDHDEMACFSDEESDELATG